MDSFEEQLCRLCLSTVNDKHFKEINDVTKSMFDVLLLKLNLDDGSKYVMCNVCSLSVVEAFRFKSMCVYTDNTIIPYVDDETDCSIDLKEIYLKETAKEHLIPTLEGYKVCRLCLHPVKDKFISAQEMPVDMIEMYIPEINLTVIEDPVICKRCFDCFVSHSNFIVNCIEVNKKMKGFCDPEVVDDSTWMPAVDSYIKTEEVDIKSENEQGDQWLETDSAMVRSVYEGISNKINDSEIKAEDEDQNSEAARVTDTVPADSYKDTYNGRGSQCDKYDSSCKLGLKRDLRRDKYISRLPCDACDFGIKRKSDLRDHPLRHKNFSETKAFECDMCDFKTKYKMSLKQHQLAHKDMSEVEVFECDTCDYKTKRKSNLKTHQLIHKDISEVEVFECDTCDYKTKLKQNLKTHQLTHNDVSEVKVFDCDRCDFKTRYKNNFTRHQRIHEAMFKMEEYECDTCDYKTKVKWNLKKHQQIHNAISGTEVFACYTCDYKTKVKRCLGMHQLSHKDIPKTELFKCVTCEFKTKNKYSLNQHQLRHKDVSERETKIYVCYTCDYKTKRKSDLRIHFLSHKDISETEVFQCETCDYKTKYKNSFKRHQQKHIDITETKVFECHTCGNKFMFKFLLRKHIQVKHRDLKL